MKEKRLSPEEKAAFVKKMNDGKKAKASTKGRSPNQGVKLLYIRDYLQKYTNKEHPKNANEISEYLASKGIKADRKTIYTDILRLQTEFMEPIEYNPKKCGYYITEPDFSLHELRMIIACAQSADFLTPVERQQIINKIATLANVYDRESVVYEVENDEESEELSESIMEKVRTIEQAISQNKQIRFRNYFYFPGKTNRANNGKEYVKPSDGSEYYVVSPRKIIRYNGNFLLICFRSNSEMDKWEFGVRRMEDIKILSIDRECVDIEYESKLSSEEQEECDLFWQEIEDKYREYAVTLLFRKRHAEHVLKKFGYDTVLVPDEDSRYCRATVHASLDSDLFGWLCTTDYRFIIISPQHAIDAYREFLENILHTYDNGTLV